MLAMSVEELIKILEKLPQSAKVCGVSTVINSVEYDRENYRVILSEKK